LKYFIGLILKVSMGTVPYPRMLNAKGMVMGLSDPPALFQSHARPLFMASTITPHPT